MKKGHTCLGSVTAQKKRSKTWTSGRDSQTPSKHFSECSRQSKKVRRDERFSILQFQSSDSAEVTATTGSVSRFWPSHPHEALPPQRFQREPQALHS